MWALLLKFVPSLASVDVKRVTIVALGMGCATLYAYIHEENVQLSEAKLVYIHPKVITKTITRREIGPVRIITKIVERPGGEKETTIDETEGPISETIAASSETIPVPLAVSLALPRSDRYLVSVGMNRLTADFDGKAMFVGYGFKNRLDVQVGGIEHNGFSPWVLATLRF